MTVVVTHPPGMEAERRYAADVLLGDFLGLPVECRPADRADVELTLAGERGAVTLPDDFFARPRVPERADALLFGDDLLGAAFFLLTRWEETVTPVRDARGRFPHSASVLGELVRRPLVNEYADLLWERLSATWPRLERRRRSFAVVPSHDVDWPRSPRPALRTIAGDASRRDVSQAWARVRAVAARRDPNDTFDWLMDEAERRGLASAFYFIAGRTVPLDGNYDLDEPWVRALLRRIHVRGHELGLHGSYATFRDPDRVASEARTLRRVVGEERIEQDSWGGRQHYLRWENPITWRSYAAAGLDYDSTLAFHDRAGFRCGTCYDFPVFDLQTRQQLPLRERPLVVMEVTVIDHEAKSVDEAADVISSLKEACRRHDGTFTVLWHNSRLVAPRERELYLHALDD